MASILSTLSSGTAEVDDHLHLVENVDWAATSVGPLESWPQELTILVHLILLDPQPRLLLLGTEYIMLYNLPYAEFVGNRHPGALGRPIRVAFPDTYSVTEATLDEVITTGRAAMEKHYCMPMIKKGKIQECHMSWIVVPFPKTSSLVGFSVMLRDESEKRIAERRASTIRELSNNCIAATTFPALWTSITSSLFTREHDCPFALVYAPATLPELNLLEEQEEPLDFHFQGSVGLFEDDSLLPKSINLDNDPFGRILHRAMSQEDLVFLHAEDQSLPITWAQAASSRGYEEPCTKAVVIPLRSQRYQKTPGFLIVGLSTRTPFDEIYKSWILELGRLFDGYVTSIITSQDRIRRREEAVQELAMRVKEVNKINLHHQRLVRVLELSEVGVFECDTQGNLVQANTAWYELSGYPPHSPKSAFLWLNYVYEKDTELVMNNWNSMLKGEPKSYEMRWKSPTSPDGRWILAVCLPVMDERGRVISISGCTTDIDAQKRVSHDAVQRAEALERASASEQRFLRFTQSSPVAVHIVELPDMKMSYCNDTWFEMTGHPRVPYNEIDWGHVFFESDRAIIRADCDAIVRTRQSRLTQFRLRRMWISGDGHRYQCWGSSSSHPELDEDGQVRAIMTTTTDISHLKWAEEVQKSRVEEALEAKKQQENFIDMTSHEIRNPLGAVVVCADAIQESLVEIQEIVNRMDLNNESKGNRLRELIASSADAVDTISSCSAHQKRIVDDLLTLSKLDSNLLQINLSPIRAMNILDDMKRVFEVEASRAGIQLRVQADASLETMDINSLMLDSGRIQQILINLVTNALKFTKDRRDPTVTITMGASKQKPSEDAVLSTIDFVLTRTMSDVIREPVETNTASPDQLFLWFSVKDTGRGISPEERKNLFSRFSQGSPRTYSKYGGSGLGLFISRELAELQGGEIGVSSAIGVGSTFAFFVKTQPSTPDSQSTLRTESSFVNRQRRGSRQTDPALENEKVHVLVVEDNQVNQRVLKRQLSQKGYEVYTADNGQEALDFLATTKYWSDSPAEAKELHVILMDIEMPVMDGLSAAKRIRELQNEGLLKGHVPIMAVSANARPEQTSMAILAGMDDSVAKPFRIADLLPKIERLADLAY